MISFLFLPCSKRGYGNSMENRASLSARQTAGNFRPGRICWREFLNLTSVITRPIMPLFNRSHHPALLYVTRVSDNVEYIAPIKPDIFQWNCHNGLYLLERLYLFLFDWYPSRIERENDRRKLRKIVSSCYLELSTLVIVTFNSVSIAIHVLLHFYIFMTSRRDVTSLSYVFIKNS